MPHQKNQRLAFPYFSLINVFWASNLASDFAIFTQVLPSKWVDIRNINAMGIQQKHVWMYIASEFCERKQNHWRFESLATITNLSLDFLAKILKFGVATWNFLPQQFLLNPKVNILVCFSLYSFKSEATSLDFCFHLTFSAPC